MRDGTTLSRAKTDTAGARFPAEADGLGGGVGAGHDADLAAAGVPLDPHHFAIEVEAVGHVLRVEFVRHDAAAWPASSTWDIVRTGMPFVFR